MYSDIITHYSGNGVNATPSCLSKLINYSISFPTSFPKIFSSLIALTSIKSRKKGSFKLSSAPRQRPLRYLRGLFM